MVKKLCRLNQRHYWLRNFLLEQISSHIRFIVTFCEPFLFPDIALDTVGTIVTRTSLAFPVRKKGCVIERGNVKRDFSWSTFVITIVTKKIGMKGKNWLAV